MTAMQSCTQQCIFDFNDVSCGFVQFCEEQGMHTVNNTAMQSCVEQCMHGVTDVSYDCHAVIHRAVHA